MGLHLAPRASTEIHASRASSPDAVSEPPVSMVSSQLLTSPRPSSCPTPGAIRLVFMSESTQAAGCPLFEAPGQARWRRRAPPAQFCCAGRLVLKGDTRSRKLSVSATGESGWPRSLCHYMPFFWLGRALWRAGGECSGGPGPLQTQRALLPCRHSRPGARLRRRTQRFRRRRTQRFRTRDDEPLHSTGPNSPPTANLLLSSSESRILDPPRKKPVGSKDHIGE